MKPNFSPIHVQLRWVVVMQGLAHPRIDVVGVSDFNVAANHANHTDSDVDFLAVSSAMPSLM